ncbi:MAG: hypothetical protein M0Z82_02280 [Actinomycetota bacterium]|jgi:hypothetical protein|nr:hypothetical protein [Actinomycetota bacterium]
MPSSRPAGNRLEPTTRRACLPASRAAEHSGRAPQSAAPLSAPIGFRDRLAHQRLDKLDLDLAWETSVRETPVLLRIVERLHDQLGTEQHTIGATRLARRRRPRAQDWSTCDT